MRSQLLGILGAFQLALSLCGSVTLRLLLQLRLELLHAAPTMHLKHGLGNTTYSTA